MEKYLFENLQLLALVSEKSEKLNGKYTPNELSDLLIEKWIPYTNCNACGKSSYCKYTIKRPDSDRFLENKCGVTKDALRNFILKTINCIDNKDNSKKQNYLDAAFYFCEFVNKIEQLNGIYIDKKKLDWMSSLAPSAFGNVVSLRIPLNNLAQCLKQFPDFKFYSDSCLLLVEGQSEKAFINKLKVSGFVPFSDIVVESYEGEGNSNRNRIQMLIDDYFKRDYKVFIQGDIDGPKKRRFNLKIGNNTFPESNIFQFAFDFETSIPSKLLYCVLLQMQVENISNITLAQFESKTKERKRAIKDILIEEFAIDISRIKVKLAEQLAATICQSPWHEFKNLEGTELGNFLNFLGKIH